VNQPLPRFLLNKCHWPLFALLAGCAFSPSDAEIASRCGVSEQEMVQAQSALMSKSVGSYSSIGKCKLMKAKDNSVVLAMFENPGQEK
jgi:hypothetical protein